MENHPPDNNAGGIWNFGDKVRTLANFAQFIEPAPTLHLGECLLEGAEELLSDPWTGEENPAAFEHVEKRGVLVSLDVRRVAEVDNRQRPVGVLCAGTGAVEVAGGRNHFGGGGSRSGVKAGGRVCGVLIMKRSTYIEGVRGRMQAVCGR